MSSVIPAMILGKGRSVLLQFFLCLTITFVAVSVEDILTAIMGATPTTQMQAFSAWFQNPIVAGVYLSAPYFFMLYLDIHTRRKSKKERKEQEEQKLQETEALIMEEAAPEEQEVIYSEGSSGATVVNAISPVYTDKIKGKSNLLYGIAAICFILALVTFWFDRIIFSTLIAQQYKLLYITLFAGLGFILAIVGYYTTKTIKQIKI